MTEVGHSPMTLMNDWSIRRACDPNTSTEIPNELRTHLIVQRFMQTATLRINDAASIDGLYYHQVHQTVDMLEAEFNSINLSPGATKSWMTRLRIQASRMYLQNMHFLDDTPSDERRAAIMRLYRTAMTLITDLIVGDESSHELLQYAPLSVVRWIFGAALVLFRVTFSTYGTDVDPIAAKVSFKAAAFAIRHMAVRNSEGIDLLRIPTRLADILSALWRRGEQDTTLQSQKPTMRVKSRLGNNLQADCMTLLRDYILKELGHLESEVRNAPTGLQPDAEEPFLASLPGLDIWPFHAYKANGAGSENLMDDFANHTTDFASLFDPFDEMMWLQDS